MLVSDPSPPLPLSCVPCLYRTDCRCGLDNSSYRQVSLAWIKKWEFPSKTNIGYKDVFHEIDAWVVGWVRPVLNTAAYNRDKAERGQEGKEELLVLLLMFFLFIFGIKCLQD